MSSFSASKERSVLVEGPDGTIRIANHRLNNKTPNQSPWALGITCKRRLLTARNCGTNDANSTLPWFRSCVCRRRPRAVAACAGTHCYWRWLSQPCIPSGNTAMTTLLLRMQTLCRTQILHRAIRSHAPLAALLTAPKFSDQ